MLRSRGMLWRTKIRTIPFMVQVLQGIGRRSNGAETNANWALYSSFGIPQEVFVASEWSNYARHHISITYLGHHYLKLACCLTIKVTKCTLTWSTIKSIQVSHSCTWWHQIDCIPTLIWLWWPWICYKPQTVPCFCSIKCLLDRETACMWFINSQPIQVVYLEVLET